MYLERTVTARLLVFLDDGGVMNDNNTRALQWQGLVSEFFIPLLGGSSDAWSRANWLALWKGWACGAALVVSTEPT